MFTTYDLSRPLLLVISVIMLASCATTKGLVDSKNDGLAVNYAVSGSKALEITLDIFSSINAKIDPQLTTDSLVVAKSWNTGWSMGTAMAAWIDPIDSKNSKVTVLMRRRYRLQALTDITEDEFHQKFHDHLPKQR